VGWIIELSVIRFWNSTQDRGLLVEYRVFGISIGFGIHSPPVICFFLEPFKGEDDFVYYIFSFATQSASPRVLFSCVKLLLLKDFLAVCLDEML
jgi:hypothetical protein